VKLPRTLFFAIGLLSLAFAVAPLNASAAPKVGISYLNWFDNGTPSGDCSGSGWTNHFGSETKYPFQVPYLTKSYVFGAPGGYCYSSDDPNTAKVEAASLDEMGVDFVVLDDTNLSKTMDPSENPGFKASKAAVKGFSEYTHKNMQVTYQLSLTCWAEQCWNEPGNGTEIFTYNSHVQKTVEEVYKMYQAEPSRFVTIAGKPLLLFYLSKGNNVMSHANQSQPAFHGTGNIYPTTADWNPKIIVNGKETLLRSVFSVRWGLWAVNNTDYSVINGDIWPTDCSDTWCRSSEAGYTHLSSPAWSGRSIPEFNRMVDEAQAKNYLFVDNWNGFSSTDETLETADTIEPNTSLSYGGDPWYWYNKIKDRLNRLHAYEVVSRNSNKCMDVTGESAANGAKIQQWECRPGGSFNQFFSLVPQGFPYYQFVNGGSGKCFDVTGESLEAGALLQQWDCIGISQTNQLWKMVPTTGEYFELVNKRSGLCADVVGVSTANGAKIQQYPCYGSANQEWRLAKQY
jgi:hypothetical protein